MRSDSPSVRTSALESVRRTPSASTVSRGSNRVTRVVPADVLRDE